MKILPASMLFGALAFGNAVSADYSVGIVDAGVGFSGAGTALNVYLISTKGVELVKGSPYVFPQRVPSSGNPYEPVQVSLNPDHDRAYVAYVGIPSLPIIVAFRITPHGLVYQWQEEFSTGDAGLQGSSISTVANFLIENTYPAEGLWVHVLNESGHEVLSDSGTDGENLVSSHVDPTSKFYYSCRFISPSMEGVGGPANSVTVYRLGRETGDDGSPWLTSTDPVFVNSECN